MPEVERKAPSPRPPPQRARPHTPDAVRAEAKQSVPELAKSTVGHQFDTRDLEQSLLSLLLSNQFELRQNVGRVRDDMFNSEPRKWIWEQIRKLCAEAGTTLSEDLFNYELNSNVQPDKQTYYQTEWNIIRAKKPIEPIGVIMERIGEAMTGRSLAGAAMEILGRLNEGNVEEALKQLQHEAIRVQSNRPDRPVVDAFNCNEFEAQMRDRRANPNKYKGVPTGFSLYDKMTGGLFPAELYMVAAVSGAGKSTFMKQVAVNVVSSGLNVLHITNEESLHQVWLKYQSVVSNVPYFVLKNTHLISDSQFDTFERSIEERRRLKQNLFIKEIEHGSDVRPILQTYYELQQRGTNIDMIVIDYLDHLTTFQKAYSEYDEQGKTAMDVKGICVALNLPVVIATQAATGAEAKQERRQQMAKYDVFGTKRKTHVSNCLMYVLQRDRVLAQLQSNGGDRKNERDCDWILDVDLVKNRDGAPFFVRCRHQVHTGRVNQDGSDDVLEKENNTSEIQQPAQITEDEKKQFEQDEKEAVDKVSQAASDIGIEPVRRSGKL